MDFSLKKGILLLLFVVCVAEMCRGEVFLPNDDANTPKKLTFLERSNFTLKCQKTPASSQSRKTVWYHNDVKMNRTGSVWRITRWGSLRLTMVALKSAGLYSCTVPDFHEMTGWQRSFKVSIEAPASIVAGPDNQDVNIGESVTLECQASGTPPPQIHWLENNRPVVDTASGLLYKAFSLTVNVSENSTYCCVAENIVKTGMTKTSSCAFLHVNASSSCKIYSGKVCSKTLGDSAPVFGSPDNQASMDALAADLIQTVVPLLGISSECLGSAEQLVCQALFPPCDRALSKPQLLPICRRMCLQVEELKMRKMCWYQLRSLYEYTLTIQDAPWWLDDVLSDCNEPPNQGGEICGDISDSEETSQSTLSQAAGYNGSVAETLSVKVGPKRSLVYIIAAPVAAVFIVIVAGFIAVLSYWTKCKKTRSRDYLVTPMHDFQFGVDKLPANQCYHQRFPSMSESTKLEKFEYPRNDILFLENIGEGAFGMVFKAEALGVVGNDDSAVVAVRTLSEHATPRMKADFTNEADLLCELDHPSILRLLAVCTIGKPMCAIVEYMEHGELRQFLRERHPHGLVNNNCKEPAAISTPNISHKLSIVRQIASGMLFLSVKGYIHRDLATRNCLVGENLCVKIADFGLTRHLQGREIYVADEEEPVPIRWSPLEAILFNQFTLKSDVWSFGVVMWEVFSYAQQPYSGRDYQEVIEYLRRGQVLQCPDNTPEQVYDLMRLCWYKVPDERPDFKTIYNRLCSLEDFF